MGAKLMTSQRFERFIVYSHLIGGALRNHGPIPLDALKRRLSQLHFPVHVSSVEPLVLEIGVEKKHNEENKKT